MSSFLREWGEKINWNKRVKSVCKPCWELKYCPYGILVEEFPLRTDRDDKSCKIFGHDCPVFHVAEPFSETRELRNINRKISRSTQFKVLKRDNQICQECEKSVLEDDIEFDHIIPWSKGGHSDQSNITTLCSNCNKKKGNDFEFKNLINSIQDLGSSGNDESLFKFLETLVMMGQMYHADNGHLPNPDEIAKHYNLDEVTKFEERASDVINDMEKFYNDNNSIDIPKTHHKALRKRWGFDKKKNEYPLKMLSLKEVAESGKVPLDKLLVSEIKFVEKLGFSVSRDKKTLNKWKEL